MKQTLLAALTLTLAGTAGAAAIEADVAPGITQCGFYLNGAATPTVVSASGGKCRFVLQPTLAVGTHSVEADGREVDPLWGTRITARSAPFVFTKSDATSTSAPPSNLSLVP
jgi:hypothetical protein